MTTIEIIENKISIIQKYLRILESYKQYSLQEIQSDVNIRGALERYLYLAVQASIDLAEAVIAYKKFRKPTTLRESFYILEEENIIGLDLSEKLAQMVGFRNILAHDYEKLDYAIVLDVLHHGVGDIEAFITTISDLF
jgi:uncharacterized protein YutE (UPF0331/DUF86 family)